MTSVATVDALAAESRSAPMPVERLRHLAAAEDQDNGRITASVDALRAAGWLIRCLPLSLGGESLGAGGAVARASVRALSHIAEYSLPLARLLEGHVNALGLVCRWGTADLQSRVADQVRNGLLLGVWGADMETPVSLDAATNRLTGKKRYASGLGDVGQAVITARTDAGVQLCLVDVSDQERADVSPWQMNGMRASASGHYDFSNLAGDSVEPFGKPNVYQIEPWFHGGVWRIAAVQIGGVFGALELARDELRQLGRLDNDAQVARLAPILFRARAARELITTVASHVDEMRTPADPDTLMAESISTRLLTEEIGLDAISAVQRSIGLPLFESNSHVGRQCRDLATYLRQAAPDGLLQLAGRVALLGNESLSGRDYP
ncbi:hypothetical protein ACUNV4_12080 [Granulosicoccus sp. 3-233]|uniref:hypothetical protein n=1 Tax=Granulosicoccus sp. 3-233 TaxID=3417969 RepID=UPI003D358368